MVEMYSLILGLKKKIKEVSIYLVAFLVTLYFSNPELLQKLLEDALGNVGYGALAMGIIGVFINYWKTQGTMPRLLE